MDAAWRFRVILFMAVGVIIFGDILGYGSAKGEKTTSTTRKTPNRLNDNHPELDLNEDDRREMTSLEPTPLAGVTQHSAVTTENLKKRISKVQLSESLRDACLPKLLCEMAARPSYLLTEREKDLLTIIKSTTLSLTMAVAPTKWHFATHMGQLLRYSTGYMDVPSGCAQLWPQCPYSTKKLMKLTSKVDVKT